MQIQIYDENDWQSVSEIFISRFSDRYRALHVSMSRGLFRDMLAELIDEAVSSAAWVALKEKKIIGFVSAHIGESGRGIITNPAFDLTDIETGDALLQTAEKFLLEKGITTAVIDGVDREYKVGFGQTEHLWLLDRGYTSYCYREDPGLELYMELDFNQFRITPSIAAYRQKNEKDGFVFEFLQEKHVEGLKRLAWANWMLSGLKEPLKSEPSRYPYIICRQKESVVGFCGSLVVDEQYGRGGFHFIMRDESYRHRRIGAVMLSMALKWLKESKQKVQVLSTTLENPAQKLYQEVGFRYSFVSAREVGKQL